MHILPCDVADTVRMARAGYLGVKSSPLASLSSIGAFHRGVGRSKAW